MDKLRLMVLRELGIEKSGSYLDEESDDEESEGEEKSIAHEETTDEEEMTDEEEGNEADGKLQTSPDDTVEETDEANDEDEQRSTRNLEK
ncbi:Hypothetical predicted protein [Octopus vulgaris]|uniref:Uncharacterized protein n=1 Tax=Octopus vulgaris TaxID=6645 RepID=A0AA36BB00_OCTVU|nr:Hypothetical predicted protein [Octopus vulgaris]